MRRDAGRDPHENMDPWPRRASTPHPTWWLPHPNREACAPEAQQRIAYRTLAALGRPDDMAQILAGRPTRETTLRRASAIHSREVTSRGY